MKRILHGQCKIENQNKNGNGMQKRFKEAQSGSCKLLFSFTIHTPNTKPGFEQLWTCEVDDRPFNVISHSNHNYLNTTKGFAVVNNEAWFWLRDSACSVFLTSGHQHVAVAAAVDRLLGVIECVCVYREAASMSYNYVA